MIAATIKIGLLDDHRIIIDGLKLLLQSEPRFQVIVEETSSERFLGLRFDMLQQIDVLVLDLNMPQISGLEVARKLLAMGADCKILVLSMNTDTNAAGEIMDLENVRGFVPKSVDQHVLHQALHTVADGGFFVHQEFEAALSAMRSQTAAKNEVLPTVLSAREMDIVRLIARGFPSKQIATTLFISENTVATHRKNIFRKTGFGNVAALVQWAIRSGMEGL